MKNNKNIDFLNTIYQISEMGVIGINDILDKVSQAGFREFLEQQKEAYEGIMTKSEDIFTSYGAQEKELGKLVKVNSKVMSEMKLIKNDDDTIIAKMMVEGTNKGILKLNEAINSYDESDEEAVALAKKLLSILEHNINGLKIYL